MGVGLEIISAGVILAATAGRDCTVGGAGTSASPKPACCTLPRGAEGRSTATPPPNPVLATTPRAPLAPPVPLPYPGPVGRSKPPDCAMFTGDFPVLSFAGTPFGSPNPPVWTCAAGRSIVCGAELPVEKTLVRTAFGITGAADGGKLSSFFGAIFTSGTGVSSTAFGLGRG